MYGSTVSGGYVCHLFVICLSSVCHLFVSHLNAAFSFIRHKYFISLMCSKLRSFLFLLIILNWKTKLSTIGWIPVFILFSFEIANDLKELGDYNRIIGKQKHRRMEQQKDRKHWNTFTKKKPNNNNKRNNINQQIRKGLLKPKFLWITAVIFLKPRNEYFHKKEKKFCEFEQICPKLEQIYWLKRH